MLSKQLFFLTSDQLCAYQWERGRLSPCTPFSADRTGMDAFAHYLATYPDRPAYLLADMIEEDFQRQLLPHVGGRARRGLIARRINLLYRDTPFRHALIQGRSSVGRRDDKVLFSALTNPALVQPWLNVIAHVGVPLAAVYSASFLSTLLVRALALSQEHLLLILRDSGGLRQTYFQGRHIKFSRLTALVPDADLGSAVAAETERMQQFLTSTRLTGRGDLLHTVVLAARDEVPALETACTDGPEIAFHFLDYAGAALRLRLPAPENVADPLLLALVARHTPASHYPTGEPGRLYRLWQTRMGLYGGAGAVLAASVAWTAANVWHMVDDTRTAKRLAAEAPQFEARYRAVMATMPQAIARTASMKAAVTIDETVRAQGPHPLPLMAMVSAALERAPAVRLNALDWQVASSALVQRAGDQPAQMGQASDAPAPLYSAELGLPSPAPQTLRIDGEIDVPENDARAVLAAMNAFALDLARDPHVAVEIETPPVDVRSNVRLSGKAGLGAEPHKPTFAMRVAWKP
ncbi:MAG TPA: hypothetical protein VFF16_09350 [Telluria sp.]|nr:hypothetical protein [Telluria sp.]